ncbi:universal stress protein [Halomicroarcula sp. F13]|uniref:Universal stress protein n=1 Tax=Haloarcula rubra TaxID=2487747 RepID=A0AAW4PVS2_9EURY|nr:universal stress protein [Halomicroarcula rubra]MBX0325143.1 universal stress protein [Halomicroarcula rubra]
MKRGLVSLRDTETHRDLMAEAAEWLHEGHELVVLWHLDGAEYDADVDTLESVGQVEHVDYDHSAVIEGAAADAKAFTEPVLSNAAGETRVVVAVDSETNRAQTVLETADEHDCDHVFIVGSSRSPTGKAVFGDFAQRVILNFDGFTTIVTE